MSLVRQLTRGLRVLVRRRAADTDLADEVRQYLDAATAANVARGLSPAAARRAAQIELGNVTLVHEQVRTSGWENAVETLVTDLRYALRRLRSAPGFSAVAILTLALGIGATTTIFSAVYPILFAPLPYPHAERIMAVSDVSAGGGPLDVTFGTFLEIAARNRSFASLAVTKPWQPTLLGATEPERLSGQRVSAGYFKVLGVSPVLGRDFQPTDDRANGPRVAVVSDGLWRRRLNADPSIVGRDITLDGEMYLVIGVLPRGFENVLAPAAELWAPLQYATSFGPDDREWGHHLRMIGRLRAGVGPEQATRDLASVARTPLPEFPRVAWAALTQGLHVSSLQQDVTRGIRSTLLVVFGAVALVLAIACVNVTNLLLARGAQRRGEIAMRTALGAGRARLIRQLLTETVVLAMVGGTCGVAVAELGIRALIALSPPGVPRMEAVRIDSSVLFFALLITTIIGVIVGIIPALTAARTNLQATLQHGARRSVAGNGRMRSVLVVAEVALALMLLVGAGLLLRSLSRMFSTPAGFDPANIITMQVRESGDRFRTDAARFQFFERALEAVRRTPGVLAAGFTTQLPMSGDVDGYGARFEQQTDPNAEGAALRYAVTPGYIEAMRIPLLAGRAIGEHDVAGAPRVALINESFAKSMFESAPAAIGQRLKFGPDEGERYTIVGVVGDVKQASLAAINEAAVYVPERQWHWADQTMSLVVRTHSDPARLTAALRAAIWSVDKDQPIVRVATMEELLARSEAGRRFALVLFEAFGAAALALAAIGIYGVLSGGVTERLRELGVRSALGASPAAILALIMRRGLVLTALGAVLGVVVAAGASRAITTLLFGITRLDPLTYVAVVVLLFAVAVVACWAPAWRAAHVDPAMTLRAD